MKIEIMFSGGTSPGLPGYIWGMVGNKAVDLVTICGGWKKTLSRIEGQEPVENICGVTTHYRGKINLSFTEAEPFNAETDPALADYRQLKEQSE